MVMVMAIEVGVVMEYGDGDGNGDGDGDSISQMSYLALYEHRVQVFGSNSFLCISIVAVPDTRHQATHGVTSFIITSHRQ